MYANYFGFRDIPFRQLADPRHVYVSAGFLTALTELREAVDKQARLILLTGHAGVGKTKLLSHLQSTLDGTRPVFYLPYGALLIEDFIGFVAAALDIHLPDGPDIFGALQEGLKELCDEGDKPILLVDDAHALGGDVLESLTALFQLGAGEEPLAQLVLAARPEMEHILERPELCELEEALARVSRVHPLERDDVEPYINYALRMAGYGGEPVFTVAAIEAIATRTRGIPRLINTLCGASFPVAYGRNENPVSVETVEAAIEGGADGDTFWGDDFEPVSGRSPLPGIVGAWRERRRRWPLAAVGMGGSVALVAILVLVGSVPFDRSSASARQHEAAGVLNERIVRVESDAARANGERDRLRVELAARVEERDALAEQLARLEAMHLAEAAIVGEAPSQTILDEVPAVVERTTDDADSAGGLLAELMRAAESEIGAVTGVRVETAPRTTTFTVRPGDTLWSIANRHGTGVETLLARNNISDANKLLIGQELVIEGTPGPAKPVAASKEVQGERWYIVRAGDSLYGIGRRFESSVGELLRWNQLAKADTLQVGQRLRVNRAD